MHPLYVPSTDLANIRVLVLSLGSARLYAEKATQARRLSLRRFFQWLTCRYHRFIRSVDSCLDRVKVFLIGAKPEVQHESQLLQSPIKSKKMTNKAPHSHANQQQQQEQNNGKPFALPAFEGEDISFLRDVVKYVAHHQFDVILLQEVYSEQTFLHLCQMFKDISVARSRSSDPEQCQPYSLYSHYGQCQYADPAGAVPGCPPLASCFGKETTRTGLAVFSRWPLLSVKLHQFDPILSKTQICNAWTRFKRYILYLCCISTDKLQTEAHHKMFTGALNRANGVQYAQIKMQIMSPSATQSVMLHLFNADLLHKSFVPLKPVNTGVSASKLSSVRIKKNDPVQNKMIPMDDVLQERFVLRLCQAYELTKLINMVDAIRAKELDLQGANKSGHFAADLILVGGHFGGMLGEQFAVASHTNYAFPLCISVQDILQTFIPGLHNLYQCPERLLPAKEVPVYRAKLFHAIKSEQLFCKFLMPTSPDRPPLSPNALYVRSTASVDQLRYKCKIEFIHSKIKFGSYLQALTGGSYENLMKPMVESPRAVHIRLLSPTASAGRVGSPNGLPSPDNLRSHTVRVTEVELHNNWCTEDRKLQMIEAMKNILVQYKRQLKITLFRNSLLDYLFLFVALLLVTLLGLSLSTCIAFMVLLLLLLFIFFRKRFATHRVAVDKLDTLLDQLSLDWVHTLNGMEKGHLGNAQPWDQDSWLKFYREQKVTATLKVVHKNKPDDELGIRLVDSDEENEMHSEEGSQIVPASTTTF